MVDTGEGTVDPEILKEILVAARQAGFLGPGPIERHLLHAQGFVALAQTRMAQAALTETQAGRASARILDLGSGGGLPGLILAGEMPQTSVTLLEANDRRAQFLERAVVTCGVESRVYVVHERAEVAGRDPRYRGTFDGVVARSFGPPAVVAECGAPLLRVGGWLIVSEPPTELLAEEMDDEGRWPADPLAQLGLRAEEFERSEFGYQVLRQITPCPDRFPRRNGVPGKRPLF